MNDAAGPGYKLNRKVKLAVGKAKTTKNGFKSEGRKKKPSETEMERPSRNYKIDGAVLVKEKNRERRNYGSGVKDKRRHLGQEGYKGNIDEKLQRGQASLDWKRKRIYADQDINKEGFLRKEEAPNRKFLSRDKNDFFNSQRDTKRKSREVETSNGGVSSVRRGNSYKDKVIDGRRKSKAVQLPKDNDTLYVRDCSRSNVNRNRSSGMSDYKLKTKEKAEDRQVSTSLDESLDGLHKKQGKGKSDSTINVNQRQNRHQFLDKTTKKVVRYKKILDGESVETDMPPKKKKRVIRIDPHDISNKRLDDGISNIESTVKGKADPEEQTELSKNAQFRAIQPSPSILSFVEDNLLGRRRLIELRRSGYNIELSAPLDNVPFSTSSERERIEESAFRNKLNFFAAAKVSSSFPPADRPEIAFAGRSNVGKSSLLNALTRQWGVVRTSDKPGLTQTINFFELGTKLCLVDLPGYGFAYAKEEVKESWEELVKEYVSTRVGLKRVCLLIDTKWGMKPRDHELISLMERSQTKYQIVLTKTDVVFPLDVARRAMEIEEKLRAHKSLIQPVMMVSSKTGAGIQCLRTVLAKVARFVKV